MGWRNIDSIIRVPETYNTKLIARNGALLSIYDDAIVIIDHENDIIEYDIKPKYALVCRGYKGNIEDIYNTVSPDTIILSKSLHKKRVARYIDSCKTKNIPYISLSDKGFHKIISW